MDTAYLFPEDSLTTTTKKKAAGGLQRETGQTITTFKKMHHVIMSLMVNYYSLVTFSKAREFRVVSEGRV